jgi:hypothetical protein
VRTRNEAPAFLSPHFPKKSSACPEESTVASQMLNGTELKIPKPAELKTVREFKPK